MELQGVSPSERRRRAMAILEEVGLGDLADKRPLEMSGGQQQRVAVARAIVSQPRVVLADEPTANLDSKTAGTLLDLMEELNREHGVTFVFSTHDPMVIEKARRRTAPCGGGRREEGRSGVLDGRSPASRSMISSASRTVLLDDRRAGELDGACPLSAGHGGTRATSPPVREDGGEDARLDRGWVGNGWISSGRLCVLLDVGVADHPHRLSRSSG